MYVGVAKLGLVIDAHSLKEKRMVLRRIKDRVQEQLRITVSEVGEQDVWQRAELGVAVTSGERAKAGEMLDQVVRIAVNAGGAEIVSIAKDVMTFESEAVPFKPIDERTGSGDKAQAQDDWVPEEWKE